MAILIPIIMHSNRFGSYQKRRFPCFNLFSFFYVLKVLKAKNHTPKTDKTKRENEFITNHHCHHHQRV